MLISQKNIFPVYGSDKIAFSSKTYGHADKMKKDGKDETSPKSGGKVFTDEYYRLLGLMQKALLVDDKDDNSETKTGSNKKIIVNTNYVPFVQRPEMMRFDGDYKDTKAFSSYLAEKMSLMMQTVTPEDVSQTIKNISERTGASEETATEVLGRLTQFSGYNALENIEEELKKEKISMIDPATNILKFEVHSAPTTNDLLLYLQEKKFEIQLEGYSDYGLVIDEALIKDAKAIMEKGTDKLDILKRAVDKEETGVIILEGLYVNSDGVNVGQSVFGSSVTPEDASVAVIEKMKKENVSLETALNEDAVEAIYELFGEDTDITLITTADSKKFTPESIARNMSSRQPDANYIRAVIDTLIESELLYATKEVKDKGRELLSRYFDEMLLIYSSASISSELKTMHSKILSLVKSQGKKPDDIVYLVPSKEKSFELISHQYAKVNNIPNDKFIYYDGRTKKMIPQTNGEMPDFKGKTAVILDDICGSGDSILYNEFSYEGFSNNFGEDCDIIFAPLVTLKNGKDNITCEIIEKHRFEDKILTNHVVDIEMLKARMSFEEFNLLSKLLGSRGYQQGYACIGMPYMLPDNNSAASGLMLSPVLRYNNHHTNKNTDFLDEYAVDVANAVKEYEKEQ